MKIFYINILTTVILLALTISVKAQAAEYGNTPLTVKVMVIDFNPFIPQKENKRLNEALNWNDPKKLAEGYINDLREVSSGYINYKIVEWLDEDIFPVKEDGFVYTPESFLKCWNNRETCHQPDGSDYAKIIDDYGIIEKIDNSEIDELWIFGAPYMGFWESAMAGPGAFYINGGVYEKIKTSKAFAIMGFSYERSVAEMLHNLCHRTEATMEHFYGGWEVDKLTTNWARFAANFEQSNGIAAVGTCHWPPNANKDYDYNNPREVESSADNWLNYPDLRGKKSMVSCETWGGPDYHRNYLKWWFFHLPKADGLNEDGHLNKWWGYVFNFNFYSENGKLLK
ncbi:MAG: hypothetical protein Q7S39_06600 [Ignavibacteria bacterium]|nr:hypothetical protein [Ignavibacteria bacterium]